MGFNFPQAGKSIDLCLCIDKTGSMKPFFGMMRDQAPNLYQDIISAMEKKEIRVDHFRVRVVFFGDYLHDELPIHASDFFDMPNDLSKFVDYIRSVKPDGGDSPKDGLEALVYAIRSKWVNTGKRKRHIIALFTDTSSHDLGFGRSMPGYPEDAPKSYEELMCMWGLPQFPGEMDPYAKRLILFAPDSSYWFRIAREWDNTILMPVASGKGVTDGNGLGDLGYQSIVDIILNAT